MTYHISEAWVTATCICVDAGIVVRRKSTVSTIACTRVLARPIVIACGIVITLVGLVVFAREDLSAGSATERVSSCACNDGYSGDGVTCVDTNACAGDPCFDGVLCAAVTTQAHTVAGVVGGGTAAAAGGAAAAGTTAATGAATSAGLHSNASSSGAAGSFLY